MWVALAMPATYMTLGLASLIGRYLSEQYPISRGILLIVYLWSVLGRVMSDSCLVVCVYECVCVCVCVCVCECVCVCVCV